MKIVNGPIAKGNLLFTIKLNVSVARVAKESRRAASNLITATTTMKRVPRDLTRFFPNDNNLKRSRLSGNVYIQYPLSCIVELPVKDVDTIGELVWLIAKAYKIIYKEEEKQKEKFKSIKALIKEGKEGQCYTGITGKKYGIWGHGIEDLFFETISVYDNGNIAVGIGS